MMSAQRLRRIISIVVTTAVVLACIALIGPASLAAGPCPDFYWQNPLPQGNALNDVAALEAGGAWAVGDHGTILKTTDAGRTWTQQVSGTTEVLTSISAIDSMSAWACGEGSTVLKTTNGGTTWNAIGVPVYGDYSGVSAVTGQLAWVAGGNVLGAIILKTTDGGQSWADQSPADGAMSDASAVSPDVAWAVTWDGTLYGTIDGGGLWTPSPSPVGDLHNRIQGLSSTLAYAVTDGGNILKTTDGTTWNAVNMGTQYDLKNLSFADASTGWVVGSSGYIAVTQDAGAGWSPQVSGVSDQLNGVSAFDKASVFSCGMSGQLLRTGDGGNRWSRLSSGDTDELLSVTCAGERTAWACGFDGTILRTTNGGAGWSPQASGITDKLESIDASSVSEAWAVGENGAVLRTVDGGAEWHKLNSGVSVPLYSVSTLEGNDSVAWVSGEQGTLLKTLNGGWSWQKLDAGTDESLIVQAWDLVTAYCGVNGTSTILKTNDYGETWSAQSLIMPGYRVAVTDISVVSRDVAFASAWVVEEGKLGDFGMVFRTTDGGENWVQAIANHTRLTLFGVDSVDGINVWACGLFGFVLRSADGGQTWQDQDALQMDSIYHSVAAADGCAAWIVGNGGDIVRTNAPYLYSVSPDNALNNGPIDISLSGNGFQQGMAVNLVKGQKTIAGGEVVVGTPYRATCSFDMSGAEEGAWDVVATNTNGLAGTLVEGFHVTSGKTWLLAEGSTGIGASGSFETWILLQNPSKNEVNAQIEYLTPGGRVAGPNVALSPESRYTVNVSETLPGTWDVSTVVTADAPIVAERSMYWNSSDTYRLSSSGSIGTPFASREWYLAEGSTGSTGTEGFETWILVANPGDDPADVSLTYMTPDGLVWGPRLALAPGSRASVNVGATWQGEWSVSTKVESDVPVVAERNTYWNDSSQSRQSAHDSIGASAPSTRWYMAEGSTGIGSDGSFETWVCVANPSDVFARATIEYDTPAGEVAGPVVDLEPFSRESINVAGSVPNEYSVSTRVESDNPVVVERSTYFTSPTVSRVAAQSSIGATAPSTDWDLAEGSTGVSPEGSFESWVCVQNPDGSTAANVTIRYMTPSGPVAGQSRTLPPHSRETISIAASLPDTWSVSTRVESNVPVVAEYAVYWDSPVGERRNAHNSIGFPFE